ncbi:MAG: Dabb family protein [Gammaproteobacteria bacterium]
MKKSTFLTHGLIALAMLFPVTDTLAGENAKVSHVILVWLKKPGDEQMKKQFVEASRKLNRLPGIINRHVGYAVQRDRAIADDSFDVAVTVTLKNEEALRAYMEHPLHKKIVEESLKPLVGRIVAYDFADRPDMMENP